MAARAAARRDEFGERRRQLMRMMGRGAIAILPAAPVRIRNNDVEYAYRQDSDFFYLTGFSEPEAVAVLIPGRAQGEYILFVRDRDPLRETWDGARAGTEGATAIRCDHVTRVATGVRALAGSKSRLGNSTG